MNYIDRIERYIINDKAVIIFWKDGEKTVSKVNGDDKFDKEIGFMISFYKYLNTSLSKNEVRKISECIKDDKLKDYLFIVFNRYTYKNTIKAKKYLASLKEGK